MNTEDFVTYEQAVTLKDSGFDWETQQYYKVGSSPKYMFCPLNAEVGAYIPAPTLYQVAKWLREEWNLHIEASPFTDCSTDADGRKCDEWEFWDFSVMRVSNGSFVVGYGDREFATYESALSAGIDAALELIK